MIEVTKVRVTLEGITGIMFDKFIDYSKEQRPPEQKLYLAEGDIVVLPSENIEAFLFGLDPRGCAMVFGGKSSKDLRTMGMAHVFIEEAMIPFCDETGPITFKGFDNKKFWVHEGSGRGGSGSSRVKQERKKRPVLNRPWSLSFTMTIIKNPTIDEAMIFNWFKAGGMQIALGTYRPKWGRFDVTEWSVAGTEKQQAKKKK